MIDRNSSGRPTRGRLALWALIYALIVLYSSLAVGPSGFNFVPMNIGHAWDRFLQTPYLINGSDQRADWMANLIMLIPLGFLLCGIFDPRRGVALRVAGSLLALALCVVFVLGVKFLQLFFPGRTVSLNYITAQCLGSAAGILLFWPLNGLLFVKHKAMNGRKLVIRLLAAYAVAYFIYVLMPLDFTLSAEDLHGRLLAIRDVLWSWPGYGRSTIIRLLLVTANFLAAIPLGLLLALEAKDRSPVWYCAVSLIAMLVVFFLKLFVMSAALHLMAIGYTTAGMLAGVGLAKTIGPEAVKTARALLLRSLPLLAPVYVLTVLYVNNLLSLHWRSIPQALDALNPRGLIPFWNWYIVSKAHAVESQAVHAIMFMPIGIMLSLRRTAKRSNAGLAAMLALVFALLVETGRWFRPDLAPDFYEAATAALAAWLTVKLMPSVWRVLEGEAESGAAEVPAAHVPGQQFRRKPGDLRYLRRDNSPG